MTTSGGGAENDEREGGEPEDGREDDERDGGPEDERDDEPEGARSIFVLTATRAQAAAVFVRVPGKWWHLMRWDFQRGVVDPGAWLRGTLYPRRSDLDPDGQVLVYFLAKYGERAFMGMTGRQTFTAVSKVPWAYALAAWPEDGTWTRGYHFVQKGRWDAREPMHGDLGRLPQFHGLARTAPEQYATEKRRGWREHADCPPRSPGDAWDERREVVLEKARPGHPKTRLVLRDTGWDPEAPGAIDGRAPEYSLELDGQKPLALDDLVWADWHPTGLLLCATDDSRLAVRDPGTGKVVWEHDLSRLEPRPRPAPNWAQRW